MVFLEIIGGLIVFGIVILIIYYIIAWTSKWSGSTIVTRSGSEIANPKTFDQINKEIKDNVEVLRSNSQPITKVNPPELFNEEEKTALLVGLSLSVYNTKVEQISDEHKMEIRNTAVMIQYTLAYAPRLDDYLMIKASESMDHFFDLIKRFNKNQMEFFIVNLYCASRIAEPLESLHFVITKANIDWDEFLRIGGLVEKNFRNQR